MRRTGPVSSGATIALLILLSSTGSAGYLQPWLDATIETDSAGLEPARREISAGALLSHGDWLVTLTDTYLASDSGGAVPRSILAENDLIATVRYSHGPFVLGPGVRLRTEPGETGLFSILPDAIQAIRVGSSTPSLRLGVMLPWRLGVDVYGQYTTRSYDPLDPSRDGSVRYIDQLARAAVSWRSPAGLDLTVGGTYRRSHSDDLQDYESTFSSMELAVSAGPGSLPSTTQLMAGASFSLNDGVDHSGGDLPNRLVGHVRAVQALLPGSSISMDVKLIADQDPDEIRLVGTSASARLSAQFLRTASVPSLLWARALLTSTRFQARRLEIGTRVHLFRGLCGSLGMDLRDGPTVSPSSSGSGSRRRVILQPGIEFFWSDRLSFWFQLERERTELGEIEEWSRFSAGLEFAPPVILL